MVELKWNQRGEDYLRFDPCLCFFRGWHQALWWIANRQGMYVLNNDVWASIEGETTQLGKLREVCSLIG